MVGDGLIQRQGNSVRAHTGQAGEKGWASTRAAWPLAPHGAAAGVRGAVKRDRRGALAWYTLGRAKQKGSRVARGGKELKGKGQGTGGDTKAHHRAFVERAVS